MVLDDDENIKQVLANILQVKERGATCIIISLIPDLADRINIAEKIDYLIQLTHQKGLLSALTCVIPLMMIIYYTALEKQLNPDQNIVDAINFNSECQIET